MVDPELSAKPIKVFVSYRRKDEDTYGIVKFLCDNLPARFESQTGGQLELFVDKGLAGGAEWRRRIPAAARQCDFFLPMLTIQYLRSEHCLEELRHFLDSRARGDRKSSLVPVILIDPSRLRHHCPPDKRELMEELDTYNWVHADEAILAGLTGAPAQLLLKRLVNDTLVDFWDQRDARSPRLTPPPPADASRSRSVSRPAKTVKTEPGDDVTALITQAMVRDGLRHMARGADPVALNTGAWRAAMVIADELSSLSVPIDSPKQLEDSSAISPDSDVRHFVAEALNAVGTQGEITIERLEDSDAGLQLEIVEGIRLDAGYASTRFSKPGTAETVLMDPYLLIARHTISDLDRVMPAIHKVIQQRRRLVILAEDVKDQALETLVKAQEFLPSVAIKAPSSGNRRADILADIALATGGQVLTEETLEEGDIPLSALGRARKVTVTKRHSTIADGFGGTDAIIERITRIQRELDHCTSENDRERLRARIAMLAGGRAIITVGAASQAGFEQRKRDVEKALKNAREAIESGFVAGGGVALAQAAAVARRADRVTALTGDQAIGAQIALAAATVPLRQTAARAGLDGDVAVEKLEAPKPGTGLDPATGKYTDLLAAAITEPFFVSRNAIVTAASNTIDALLQHHKRA